MDHKAQINANIEAIHRIAQKTRAAINAVPQGPQNGADRAPVYPHLSKPKHTTSYVSYVSVPEDQAADYSAAVSFLWSLSPDVGANTGIVEAVIQHARACGWDPDKS